MIIRRGTSLIALVVSLILSQSALMAAQQTRRNQDQAQQGASYLPSAQSDQEYTAFTAVQAEANPATRITLGDTFLTTYPNSQLAGFVQRFRMEAFTRLNRPKDAVAAGEAAGSLARRNGSRGDSTWGLGRDPARGSPSEPDRSDG